MPSRSELGVWCGIGLLTHLGSTIAMLYGNDAAMQTVQARRASPVAGPKVPASAGRRPAPM